MTEKICQKNKASYPTFWSLFLPSQREAVYPEKILPVVYYISEWLQEERFGRVG